jgi:hypothetical protein
MAVFRVSVLLVVVLIVQHVAAFTLPKFTLKNIKTTIAKSLITSAFVFVPLTLNSNAAFAVSGGGKGMLIWMCVSMDFYMFMYLYIRM